MKPIFFEGGSWLLNGKVDETNFGEKGKEFNLFVVGGWGVHRGLTAMYDCLGYGLATEERGVLKLEDKSYGKVKALVEGYANDKLYEDFHAVLQENLDTLSKPVQPKKGKKGKADEVEDDEDEKEVDEKAVQELFDA
jgi:hypothetical protein